MSGPETRTQETLPLANRNSQGQIVDTEGNDLETAAYILKTRHDINVDNIDQYEAKARESNRKYNLGVHASPNHRRDALEYITASSNAEVGRKAALWDAHEHFQNNQAEYYQHAVESAPEGVHIKTGHHEMPEPPHN